MCYYFTSFVMWQSKAHCRLTCSQLLKYEVNELQAFNGESR